MTNKNSHFRCQRISTIGWRSRSVFSSVCVSLPIAVCTVAPHSTSPRLTSDTEACRHLRSGSTSTLFVPATRRSSLGDRAFPVAAARLWNTLPVSLRTVSSYLTFRRELTTFLFNISFPDNWTVCVTLWSGPAVIDSDTVILAYYYYY